MSHGGADPKKVVIAALIGNLVIASAKFVAAYLSGSVTMLAEGVHSLADTANQGLLFVGLALSARKDPVRYPLGRAREIYFWAFIVSLLLFFLGGVFAIVEGLEKLRDAHAEHGSLIAPVIVLGVSTAMEGMSFSVAFKEFNKSRQGKPIFQAIFSGRDPTIPLVLLEDTGAMIGLVIALAAVGLSWFTGSGAVDAIGSIVIGALLCTIGLLLAKDTHGLLIGEGIPDEVRADIMAIGPTVRGIKEVIQVLSLHLGPQSALVALKVRFDDELRVTEVERITNQFEEKLRAAHPELTHIFVEPDSSYDPTKDSDYSMVPRPPPRME